MHYIPPHVGGMELVVANQAKSLVARGHDVTVLTCRHARGLDRRSLVDGYVVKRTAAFNWIERRFGITFPLVSPIFFLRAWREIARADIVHLHDVFYTTTHLAALAAVLLRRPFHLTQHVALVEHPSRLVMAVQRAIYRLIGRPLFRRAASVVTYNANVQAHVLSHGAGPARVVLTHNGIDTDAFTPADADEKRRLRAAYGLPVDLPVVLFVGRLVPKKGFRLVAETAGPDHTTLIVGTGVDLDNLGSMPHVTAFGEAGRDEVLDLYRLADLFVFPTQGEIFTLVMQEAMACGLPVVTTDDPGYADYELDRDRIRLVPRTADAVRSAIADLLADRGLRDRMSEYSRELAVQRFSWHANYPNEYAIYARASVPAPRVGV